MLPKSLAKLASQVRIDPGIVNEIVSHMTGEGAVVTLAVGGVAALAVPTVWEMIRRLRNADGQSPRLDVSQERDMVRSIALELEDSQNAAVADALDEALADLIDEPNWDRLKSRLDDGVARWSRNRDSGAGNPLAKEDVARVLLSLIQKVREAGYRTQFAAHYRQAVSVDLRHRTSINSVYVRLLASEAGSASEPQTDSMSEGEYLDFRRLDSAGIEDTLRQATRNLVIVGEPGSGKSTMLRHLATNCAESESEQPLLPIFLNLRDYAGGREVLIAQSAVNFTEDVLQLRLPEGFFEYAMAEERCLVCLDGLDEVQSEDRRRVSARVEQLARNHPRCVFVVSSRGAGYYDAPLDDAVFQRYTIEPMDDEGIRAFLDWRFGAGSEAAQGLWDAVNRVPALKTLVSNPLQLAMLNLVYREDAQDELPLKPTGFYQSVVERLIADESAGDDFAATHGTLHAFREDLLAAIAHHMHRERLETIGENQLQRVVARFLHTEAEIRMGRRLARREALAFVEMAEQRTGLLVGQRMRRSTQFRFLHASFREYLAARHIYLSHYTDGPEALWEEIKPHLSDVHWEEVIVFLLTGFEDDEEEYCTYLTENILAAAANVDEDDTGDEFYDDFVQYETSMLPDYYRRLATDALAGQAPMSPELQDKVISMLRDWTGAERYGALESLANIRHIPDKVVPALTEVVGEKVFADSHRVLASREIARQGAIAQAIELLTVLSVSRETETQARVFAARYLSVLGEVNTAIGVLSDIGNDPSEDTYARGLAFGVLRELGQAEVAREWLTRIAEDQAARVDDRLMAWRELAKFGDGAREKSIARIVEIAGEPDVPPQSRMIAAHDLHALGNRDEAVQIMATLALDPVANLELEDWWARGWSELVPATLIHIARDRSAADRDREWAVGAFEDTHDIRPVAQIAADASLENFIRVVAAGMLREGNLIESARAATDALNEVARDHYARPRHRYVAGSTLAALGETETAINTLAAVAEDAEADGFVRTNAADELATLGDPETALRALESISQDENVHPIARLRASDALVSHGAVDAAITALAAVSRDPAVEEWDRGSAVTRLGAVGEHAAAQDALGSIAGDRSMPELIRTLAHHALEQSMQQ